MQSSVQLIAWQSRSDAVKFGCFAVIEMSRAPEALGMATLPDNDLQGGDMFVTRNASICSAIERNDYEKAISLIETDLKRQLKLYKAGELIFSRL